MTDTSSADASEQDGSLLARARQALLDALEALREHRDSVVVIGAQAIYLHTGAAATPVAEATKDSDLAFDVRRLADQPLIDAAMRLAKFDLDPTKNQPGAWVSPDGIPVDLMVPESLAGGSGSRSAKHPPHDKRAFRRAAGLEGALIDYQPMEIRALIEGDDRVVVANVAGPAALLVAKLHKIGERADHASDKLVDKDAHDLYRIVVAIETPVLAQQLEMLRLSELAGPATEQALIWLRDLFAAGPNATGSQMAARAEAPFGTADTVAAAVAALSQDLLTTLFD
jgi:hypothetical protein